MDDLNSGGRSFYILKISRAYGTCYTLRLLYTADVSPCHVTGRLERLFDKVMLIIRQCIAASKRRTCTNVTYFNSIEKTSITAPESIV